MLIVVTSAVPVHSAEFGGINEDGVRQKSQTKRPEPDKNSSTTNVCRIPRLLDHTGKRIPLDESTFRVVVPAHLDQYFCLEQTHPPAKGKEQHEKRDRNQFRDLHASAREVRSTNALRNS